MDYFCFGLVFQYSLRDKVQKCLVTNFFHFFAVCTMYSYMYSTVQVYNVNVILYTVQYCTTAVDNGQFGHVILCILSIVPRQWTCKIICHLFDTKNIHISVIEGTAPICPPNLSLLCLQFYTPTT